MNKKIIDIRYYSSDTDNKEGSTLPGSAAFCFSKDLQFWGSRIARKLRELGLSVGSFDHVYLNYTTMLPPSETQVSQRSVEPRVRYINYGITLDEVNNYSYSDLEAFLISSTLEVMKLLCSEDKNKLDMVFKVQSEIDLYGTEIEIEHKHKETKSYSVRITYQIRPLGNKSVGYVYYRNNGNGNHFKRKFVELKYYPDIVCLVDTIALKGNKLILKPRKSFNASLHTRGYSIPIEISIV